MVNAEQFNASTSILDFLSGFVRSDRAIVIVWHRVVVLVILIGRIFEDGLLVVRQVKVRAKVSTCVLVCRQGTLTSGLRSKAHLSATSIG